MSILAKIRVLTLGAANDLLDKAIDINSPSALRQYVRDLEDALDRLRNEAAMQAGMLRTLTREIGDLQHRIESETSVVQKLMASPTGQALARTKATTIVAWKKELESKQEALQTQQTTSAGIDSAVAKLDAKHTLMVQQVRDLERTDRDTKAKEQAAHSLEAAGKLVGSLNGVSIDDIKGKMNARNDVANEKFARAMGTMEDDSSGDQAAVDDFLSSITAGSTGK